MHSRARSRERRTPERHTREQLRRNREKSQKTILTTSLCPTSIHDGRAVRSGSVHGRTVGRRTIRGGGNVGSKRAAVNDAVGSVHGEGLGRVARDHGGRVGVVAYWRGVA
jgi:hypothetical protein